jgi:hypothetical protein
MHGLIARRTPGEAGALAEDAGMPAADVRHMAQESVARSRELYRSTMSAAQGSARVFAEVAETTWGSAKLLNDKIIQNVAANAEAAFDAAEAIVAARSLPEAARLQSEFLQLLFVSTGEQLKEFVDLSGRVAQHLLETAQAAASRSMKARP